jgi:hypothetical protein
MWRLDVTLYEKLPFFQGKRLHFCEKKVTDAQPVTIAV